MTSDPSVDFSRGPLHPSENGHFLVHADGTPFFYLGDTAWELFHRLRREEADDYLDDRAAKRFTAVQAVILSEMNGLTEPNALGHLPLKGLDPTRPNEDYFNLVDYVVDGARARGMYAALLPTWGSWVVDEEHPLFEDHRIFYESSARAYGRFLGERYRDRPNVIWVIGGDRLPDGYEDVWRALARGLAEGETGPENYRPVTMTWHPRGGHSAGEHFQSEPWLTFGMVQSGHDRASKPHQMIAHEYAREPVKPVINGEPGYEGIPDGLSAGSEKLNQHDVRRFAYWSVFAGACGHTYGANEIWQMWSPDIEPTNPVVSPLLDADTAWREALDYPGAEQMQHLRALIESRPFLCRVPDQSLIASGQSPGRGHVQATRADDGSYAMLYLPRPGRSVGVRMDRLSGHVVRAWWFDPRTGEAEALDRQFEAAGTQQFTAPEEGPDRVLVLDDASRDYPPPGWG